MIDSYILAVRTHLTPDLLKPEYDSLPYPDGHCYVAAEVLWHLLGARKCLYTPHCVAHEGMNHWYLVGKLTGHVLDPTADQFSVPVDYDLGIGRGFLTSNPSHRAQTVLDRIKFACK